MIACMASSVFIGICSACLLKKSNPALLAGFFFPILTTAERIRHERISTVLCKIKRADVEREDWYYLYIGATGRYVLYEWDHVQINGPSSNGVKLIELETFLDDPSQWKQQNTNSRICWRVSDP